ncbi:hypothetical protein KAR91_08690 [Candidatus Pacearchaeota archaeon]|nr:hypothetical protein [Candidatus Pacearchaeota archaeon]
MSGRQVERKEETLLRVFKYAGETYIPVDQLLLWFQKELIAAMEDEEKVPDYLLKYIRKQIQVFTDFRGGR